MKRFERKSVQYSLSEISNLTLFLSRKWLCIIFCPKGRMYFPCYLNHSKKYHSVV